MERIKLNLIPSGVAPVVHASQYDDGREFAIDLFEGDSVYVLDGTETLTVNVRKPDGHLVVESVTNTSDSYVVIATTEQMVAVSGTNYAKLKIEKGSVTIATLEFLMSVSHDPLENGDPSESFVSNLETQIASAVADQYDSANVIFDNVPTSGHGIPYVVSSDGLLSYIPKNVSDMDDVTITTPVPGEALVFDNDGNLVNGTVSTVGNLDDLSDVDTTGKATGDSLRYDGAEWIAQPTTVALTQAEYDALQLSGDLVPNTHYVITDAPNLNPTASDIEYSGAVTVYQAIHDITDIKSLVTFNENISGTNTNIVVKCGVLYIYYQGEAKAHNANDLLFTLPSGYRPSSLRYCTYNINDSAFGEVGIDTDGKCYINHISTSGANGRVYFAVAIPL